MPALVSLTKPLGKIAWFGPSGVTPTKDKKSDFEHTDDQAFCLEPPNIHRVMGPKGRRKTQIWRYPLRFCHHPSSLERTQNLTSDKISFLKQRLSDISKGQWWVLAIESPLALSYRLAQLRGALGGIVIPWRAAGGGRCNLFGCWSLLKIKYKDEFGGISWNQRFLG